MKDGIFEKLSELLGNKYLAANIASQRARQLNVGARPRIKTHSIKHASIALEELAAGKLWYRPIDKNARLDRSLYPNIETDEEIDQEFRNQIIFVTDREERQMDSDSGSEVDDK